MRGFLILLMVLCGCQDDFVVGDLDADPEDVGGADVGIADVRESDTGVDAPTMDARGDDASADAVSAMDATLGDVASADVMEMSDTSRPMNSVRVLPHQLRLLNGSYEVNVLIAVLSGPPVNTSPANLFLRFDGGAEVSGIPFERPAANAKCSESLSVTDATGLICRVSFSAPVGVGVPVELTLVADGTRFTTPIASCSGGAIAGRCDEGLLCVAGDCLQACGASAPDDGWCFLQESCSEGECVADCSVFSPSGFCRSGACVGGACEEP